MNCQTSVDVKGPSIGLVIAICDGESQMSKEVTDVRRCHSNPCGHTDGLIMFACSIDASNGQSS